MADERSKEVVPGMAEAIEARRKKVRLNATKFAEAAGVTAQGLAPLRKGYRRQYQDKVKLGVAEALRWPDDAVDRLLAGEDPATFPDVDHARMRERELIDFNSRIARMPSHVIDRIQQIIDEEEAKEQR